MIPHAHGPAFFFPAAEPGREDRAEPGRDAFFFGGG